MILRRRDIEADGYPKSFLSRGQVEVLVGPCSATSLQAEQIPLDGRRYVCAGEIILRNGRHLRANFSLATHTFDFLVRESVLCTLDGDDWYSPEEPELLELLGLRMDEVFPYRWLSDRPLRNYDPGPYAMTFPDDAGRDE